MNELPTAARKKRDDVGPAPAAESRRAERVLSEFHYGQDHSPSYDVRLVKRLWPFLRPHGSMLLISLALIPFTSLAALVQPYLTKRAVDSVLVERDTGLWLNVLFLYAGAVALEFGCRFGQVYCMQLAGQRSMVDLRRSVYDHAHQMATRFYDNTPVGRVLTRVTNDVDSLGELFSSGAVMAVADIVMLVGIVAFMLALDWRLSLLTFAALPPLAIAVEVIRRFAREAFREIRARVAQLNAYLSEQVQGMQVVQAFGREQASAEEYRIINDAYRRANHRSIKFDAMLYSIVETVSTICLALVLWYASVRAGLLGADNQIKAAAYIGTVVAFYQYIQQFFVPIRDLSTKYTVIQSSLASAERVFGFLDNDDREPGAAPPSEEVRAAPRSPERASAEPDAAIAFEHVTFGYRPGEPVLHDVSFRLHAGEHIAIVGATGAGKTSTISLLLRFYDIDQGSIRLAGRDVRTLSLPELRRHFAVVSQEVFLFSGTVGENVAMNRGYEPERVEDALRRVGAWDLLEGRGTNPREVEVRERGANFSVGERQLLAFARALHRDAPCLILDEATANIDSETEARVQAAADELLSGRTALVVAHRLSTIRKADRILVFHKGRIAEQGTHEELLALGEIYAHLYQLQFRES